MSSAVVRLAVDAGNTRIKWGLAEGDDWLARGAVATAEPAALAEAWRTLPRPPVRVVACSVASGAVRAEIEAAAGAASSAGEVHWLRSSARCAGVTNGYDDPGQLGADRWAAVLGAWRRTASACVVVNAGTAITVDALGDTGRFLGGLILPGVATMLDALERRTAGLERQHGTCRHFPTNTADAMWTGALDAAAGAVQRVARRLSEAMPGSVPVMLAGGDAALLEPCLGGLTVHRAEHLVLEGLLAADEAEAS